VYKSRDAPNACCEIVALKSGTIEFRAAKEGTAFSLSVPREYSPSADGQPDTDIGTHQGKLMIRVYGKTEVTGGVNAGMETMYWASMFHKLIEPAESNQEKDNGGRRLSGLGLGDSTKQSDLIPEKFRVLAGDPIRFEPGTQAYDGFRFCMFPECPNTNGTLQGGGQCKCGESVCEPGQYCYRPDFYPQGECSDTTGNRVIAVGDCETDQHCVWNQGWPTTSFEHGAEQCNIEFLTEGELVTTVIGWRMPYKRRYEEFTFVDTMMAGQGSFLKTETLNERGQPDFTIVDAQGSTVFSSTAWNDESSTINLASKYPITKQEGPHAARVSITSKIVFKAPSEDNEAHKIVPQFAEKYGAYGFKLCFGACEFTDQENENPSPCVCGEPDTPSAVLCDGGSGFYCNAKLQKCKRYPLCEDDSGIRANTRDCQCTEGNGQYCTDDGALGRSGGSGLYCTRTEIQGVNGGEIIVKGTCAVGPPCKHINGTTKKRGQVPVWHGRLHGWN
jgi:hypothetical protein